MVFSGSSTASRLCVSMVQVRKNPCLSIEPHFCCLWAIGYWWTAPFFSLPLSQQGSVKNISSHSWPCLCHICKHHKWYLWKYKLILFQKHVLFLMTVHLGLSVMSLLPIMCGWEAWPCHTHRKHSCLRREGTKQSLQGKALNRVYQSTWIWPWVPDTRDLNLNGLTPKKAQY